MATVTVDPNTSYQTMKGWEATAQTGLGDFISSGVNYHDAALDAAVDLGITRIRTEALSGWVENTTDYWGNFIADGHDYSGNAAYTALQNNRRIPVDVNPGSFKMSSIAFQIDNYIVPLKAKVAARGESLFWSMCYVHFSASNQLHVDTPAEYGEFMLAIWDYLDDTYGFVPDALEIFLEPDNTAAVTASELSAMIVAARDAIVGAGYSKPYIVAPSTVDGPNARTMYLALTSTARSYVDEICYHLYGSMTSQNRTDLATTAISDGKNTSMLEYGGAYLDLLHDDLRLANNSSWAQYAISYPTTDSGYQYFLIGSGPGYAITEGERTKYIRHYTYAVRPGAVRKGVSISGTGAAFGSPLAFKNSNGTYAVVMKCSGAVTFDLAGLPNGTYEVRYTTGNGTSAPSAYWQSLSDQLVSGGNTGSIAMPGAGVITIYDQRFLDQPSTPGPFQIGGGPLVLNGTRVKF
jgi:hypothetical protein